MRTLLIITLVGLGMVVATWAMPTKPFKQLCWDPNTETDLAGYYLYWATTPGTYADTQRSDVGKPLTVGAQVCVDIVPTVVGTAVPKGTLYFVATAYDTMRNESEFSNEVSNKWPWTAWKGLLTTK